MSRMRPLESGQVAWLIVSAGIVGAMHVGKLPAAIPVLASDMGLTLVQGGFLLSFMQLAGMGLGAVAGTYADRLGPRRVLLTGLVLLAVGSGLGSMVEHPYGLMLCRAIEGMGFLLTVIPAPVLLRRWATDPDSLQKVMGLWGAYMPIGMAIALLLTPFTYDSIGWRWTWMGLALLALAMAFAIYRSVPADVWPLHRGKNLTLSRSLTLTLTSSGPWLVASAFFVYSGQWMAVIGFLPTLYQGADWPAGWIGPLTALAAGVNLVGNVAAGRLLARGASPAHLLVWGYVAMVSGAWGVFSGILPPVGQYLAVLGFSAVGGLIPATLFSLTMKMAPSGQTVTTTVGWVQQLSSMGQFVTPPLLAWLALSLGGWHHAWLLNLLLGVCGLWLVWRMQARWQTQGS